MSEPKEATMTISGVELTFAQSMTVRVALQTFALGLQADGLGSDKTGKAMTAGYLARVRELNELISRTAK